jgi:hypothetical protein
MASPNGFVLTGSDPKRTIADLLSVSNDQKKKKQKRPTKNDLLEELMCMESSSSSSDDSESDTDEQKGRDKKKKAKANVINKVEDCRGTFNAGNRHCVNSTFMFQTDEPVLVLFSGENLFFSGCTFIVEGAEKVVLCSAKKSCQFVNVTVKCGSETKSIVPFLGCEKYVFKDVTILASLPFEVPKKAGCLVQNVSSLVEDEDKEEDEEDTERAKLCVLRNTEDIDKSSKYFVLYKDFVGELNIANIDFEEDEITVLNFSNRTVTVVYSLLKKKPKPVSIPSGKTVKFTTVSHPYLRQELQ